MCTAIEPIVKSHLSTSATLGTLQKGSYQPELDSANSSYLVKTETVRSQQGQGALEEETAAQQLSHTTRASPATIHWLLQNYETAEGVSLPRCTLYNHYLKHCTEHKLDPVNAASFGKLIRSVFLGLRTRRLGTRGNSKYHYYGIRMKPDSPLSRFSEENIMAIRQKPAGMSKRTSKITPSTATCDVEINVVGTDSTLLPVAHTTTSAAPTTPVADNPDQMSKVEIQQSYLGQGTVPNLLPPMLQPSELEQIDMNQDQNILNLVRTMNFCDIDLFWRYFWQPTEVTSSLDEESTDSLSAGPSSGLTRQQLHDLCTLKPIQKYIHVMDCQFYQVIVNILLVNVLRPMPSLLTQSIRSFAKQLETSLSESLVGLPEAVQCIKLDAARSFAQILRRYTSLNHLAQAARAVLQNSVQMNQMLTDLNRVDFRNVQEQADWVCSCDFAMVQQIEQDFKEALEKPKTLEQFAAWLDLIVGRALPSCSSGEIFRLHREARKFLLHWSFYSSMLMRDLTLRSAPSFGSFHLIRLLFDEYMFFLVEQRIASATDLPAVAIMSQSYRKRFSNDYFANSLSTAEKTYDFHTQCGSLGIYSSYQSNNGVDRINGSNLHSVDACGITLASTRMPQAEGICVSSSNQEEAVSHLIPGMPIQRQQHILELRRKERNPSLASKTKIVINGHQSSVPTSDPLLPCSRDPNGLIYYCTESESPNSNVRPLVKKTKTELSM
ncbi:hypothetical protein M514_02366 [Trichuris suis]|uniref:RFX-type winged-helix domain-containing protein n=1 Tax=Trichuris suis TaxID=68888 RepID=A0A085NBP0_9BILA|nr:hypothetical protein M514_02366 [Trichuris suis]